MTLSRNQKKRILIKNYEKLTKKEKKNINDLTRQISKPTVAPNNLPTLLTSAIERTSEIKGKKYNQVNYYFSYIDKFDKDSLFRGKNDISTMTLATYKRYFHRFGKRPNPLRLHNLLSQSYLQANKREYLQDDYKFIEHQNEIKSFSYFSSIFENQTVFTSYLDELLENAFKSTRDLVNVLSQLTSSVLNTWQQVIDWSDSYEKFGDVGSAKLYLIATANLYELNHIDDQTKDLNSLAFRPTYNSFQEINDIDETISKKDFKSAFPLSTKCLKEAGEIRKDNMFWFNYSLLSSKEDLLNRAFDNICDRYARRDGNYYLDNVQFNEQQFIFIECCKILESLFQ
ncbi:hypothetical protein ACTNET_06045 [Lactobacillus amylovorus]|uniref:hypothetical protein n=1 Tax=Lactobacillus amylovorus TaxID=1604 RepID=UPI003F8B52F1